MALWVSIIEEKTLLVHVLLMDLLLFVNIKVICFIYSLGSVSVVHFHVRHHIRDCSSGLEFRLESRRCCGH